ncbi:MAG: TadE/TadG family type IV pilus assembly protein [Pseudomonadota bacterium]
MTPFRAFLRDDKGGVVLDVAVIFFPLMMLILAIFEIAISFYVIVSSQKAAQLGARVAVTRHPVHVNVPTENVVDVLNGEFGDACYQSDGRSACIAPNDAPWLCDGSGNSLGAGCDAARFMNIVGEMRRVYPSLKAEHVSIQYNYALLGYAGGPFVPHVTVRIDRRPSPFQIFSASDAGGVVSNFDGASNSSDGRIFLRPVAASAFGEDLSTFK